MSSYQERLGLLSQMVSFAKSDGKIRIEEYNFLQILADRFEISEIDFLGLIDEPVKTIYPSSEADRILQFHRLVLLMNIDHDQDPQELQTIMEYGVQMGLSPYAIKQVLQVMNQYENKIVPPDVLVSIFKTQYN
ncbi:TerB family tellurite resistance protein [Zhouia sp. PK063]|uniref:TerB family tellurite resistance protein n=1 Tax=Zhouia sp. PK063 TaxID=3373602 RepID=UPI00379EDC58